MKNIKEFVSTCKFMHINLYLHTYASLHIYAHKFEFTYICLHTYVRRYTHNICMYICMRIPIQMESTRTKLSFFMSVFTHHVSN